MAVCDKSYSSENSLRAVVTSLGESREKSKARYISCVEVRCLVPLLYVGKVEFEQKISENYCVQGFAGHG